MKQAKPMRGLFVGQLLGMVAGVILAFTSINASAAELSADSIVEGTHYQRLPIAVDTTDTGKVEVVEVFSYACIHCFNFDPVLESWLESRGEAQSFVRMPAIFNKDWELLAQAFYTAETLGVTAKVHTAIFEGIHETRTDLRQPELLAELFGELAEVSEADFSTAYNSFSVRSRVQQAKSKVRAYRVTGVPTMIVAGKYLVDGETAGGNAQMLQVVDYLVAQESATEQGAQ